MNLETLAELSDHIGAELGVSEWHEVTQDQVNTFAEATLDFQWIHTDPEHAAAGPFGGTIAHGYLTLSLLPLFLAQALAIDEVTAGINYGLNKVRFPTPVPVGRRIRGRVVLVDAKPRGAGVEATFGVTVELEGADRPACVAEAIVVYQ
jgi:acyl dehydratase